MNSLTAYKKFLLKINKNDTNSNINISKGEFVLIFNEQARRWLREKIKNKQIDDTANDISELLVSEEPLPVTAKGTSFVEFQLPDPFFDYVTSTSDAIKQITYQDSQGETHRTNCKGILYNWDTKAKNLNTLFMDDNHKPSFEFQESFITIYSDKIKVYKTDFNINTLILTYYREPWEIDIAGYKRIDGSPSTNINPQFIDANTDEIISRAAVEAARNYQDPEQVQIGKDRINTED